MADLEKMGIEKLSDTNFATWSIQMKSVLISKKLWAAVRDDPPAPDYSAPFGACESQRRLGPAPLPSLLRQFSLRLPGSSAA